MGNEQNDYARKVPILSIGMPVYNGEAFIRQALDSLLGQTYSSFELIISDNASTDSTGAICQDYATRDHRIRYFRQEANRGNLSNFDFVLREARGERFMWAAADDEWSRDWIEILLRNMREDVAISFGHVVSIDSDGHVLRNPRYCAFSKRKWIRLFQYYWREESSYKANLIYGIYWREMLSRVSLGQYWGRNVGGDMHLVFTLAQEGCLATDSRTYLRKRILPAAPTGQRPLIVTVIKQVSLFHMLKYYAAYVKYVNGVLGKALFSFLLPGKYVKSVVILVLSIMATLPKKISMAISGPIQTGKV